MAGSIGSGDIDKENLVKRIFQELYLGRPVCVPLPSPTPFLHRPRVIISRNELLIPERSWPPLRKKVRMGIASGRPRFEAELALKRFQLLSYFDSVVTLDECEEEEKTHPQEDREAGKTFETASLLHPEGGARDTESTSPRCGYIGDVVDDMQAARAAKKTARDGCHRISVRTNEQEGREGSLVQGRSRPGDRKAGGSSLAD